MPIDPEITLQTLERFEPLSLQGQAPVVWERAEGVHVWDVTGRRYLDFSSGVLVANVGHGHPEIVSSIVETVSKPLLFSYSFPSEERAALLQELEPLLPRPDDKVMLLSTGAEAIECALKLVRTHALRTDGDKRSYIVSFERGFHGRTAGAQLAGGIPALKEWLFGIDAPFVNVPFPDGFRTPDTSFASFEAALSAQGVAPEQVAGVIIESYQGGGASFAPAEYMQALATWCAKSGAILIVDEVQSGFGRTGKWFAYEHYGITPDLVVCGKGISSSMPLSAVIGRRELLDQFAPGSMSSTHGGHPICCAAARANLRVMRREGIVERAAELGEVMCGILGEFGERFGFIGAVHGRGLVHALHVVKPGTHEPDADAAGRIVSDCVTSGLMLFAPVGFGGANIKLCPPLVITTDQLREGLEILEDALQREEARDDER